MWAGRKERGMNGRMKKLVGRWPQKEVFEEWLQRRDKGTYDRYLAQRVVVKQRIKVKKNGELLMVSVIKMCFGMRLSE